MLGKTTALVCVLGLAACSAIGVRTAPEPRYAVIGHAGAAEIRQYVSRLAAETTVAGEEPDARDTGFRRLAHYISGGNRSATRIEMTSPVAQQQAGQEIGMTRPVAQGEAEGGWTIRFFMPASYKALAQLPVPDDPQVKLVTVPAETMAVLRYAGSTAPEAVQARTSELIAALETGAWRPAGEPVAWFYDPPWTMAPLRRNEVAVPVSPK